MKIDQRLFDILRDAAPHIMAHNILNVNAPWVPLNTPTIQKYMTTNFGGPSSGRARGTMIKKLPKGQNLDETMYDITNDYYRNFLRLNNRRKTQDAKAFRKAGYPEVRMKINIIDAIPEWVEWMDTNIGQYNYFYAGGLRCFLLNDDLKTLYLLRWG